MGRTITFSRPDGGSVSGYLAEPADPGVAAGAPALVVIQEWWGLNDQIRGVADRFAQQGYRALVPDLYRGKSTLDAEEAGHLMGSLNFGDAAGQDVAGAVAYLKGSGSAKCGVTGFCMGGALTLLAAVNVPAVDAAVIFYGLIFGLADARKLVPEPLVESMMAIGVLIYGGVGVAGLLLGGHYLDYFVLDPNPVLGQHRGIFWVEVGVAVTVSGVMLKVFYMFADRGKVDDE